MEVAWSQGRTQADVVCICAGAWSSQIDIEGYPPVEHARVEPVRGQMIAYSPVKSPPARIELSGGTYLIPRKDRRVLVGSTLEHVGFDNATTEQAKNALRAAAETLAPTLKDGNIEHHWAGLRPKVVQSPDPVIGPSPSVPGLWFNTGHFRNGVTLAAGSAVRLASQVAAS